jgi:PEP-CTERM motif-containing protein
MIKFKAVLASISLLAGVVQFSPSAWATDYLYSYSGSYGKFTYVSQGGFVQLDVETPLEELQSHSFVPDLEIVSLIFDESLRNDEIQFLSLPCENDSCDLSEFAVGSFFAVGTHMGQDVTGVTSTLSVSVYTPGTPEASTWAMMLLGFGGIGFASYLRPRKSPTFG